MNHANPNNSNRSRQSTPDTDWWGRLVDHINAWWIERQPTVPAVREALRIPPWPATALILFTGLGVVAVVATLLWWLLIGILSLAVSVATGIRDTTTSGATTGTRHVAAWSLTRTITNPVRLYLDQHAAGLPVTGHALWLTWLATTAGLLILAVVGSRGARIGWILTGATTTAMVYAATPTHNRALAAGLAVTAWAVLSVAAFNRLAPTDRPMLLLLRLPRRPYPVGARTGAGTD